MDRFSIREVIEQAIQTEKLGYQFYTSIAEKFKKEADFFRLFTDLADKEVAHEKTFRSLLDKVKDTEPENWQECELYLRAVVESEFFLGKNKSLPSMEQVKSIDNGFSVRKSMPDRRHVLPIIAGKPRRDGATDDHSGD